MIRVMASRSEDGKLRCCIYICHLHNLVLLRVCVGLIDALNI